MKTSKPKRGKREQHTTSDRKYGKARDITTLNCKSFTPASRLSCFTETWRTTKTMLRKAWVFINKCLRSIRRIWWPETVRHDDLWQRTGPRTSGAAYQQRGKSWIGHSLHALTGNPSRDVEVRGERGGERRRQIWGTKVTPGVDSRRWPTITSRSGLIDWWVMKPSSIYSAVDGVPEAWWCLRYLHIQLIKPTIHPSSLIKSHVSVFMAVWHSKCVNNQTAIKKHSLVLIKIAV